MTCPAWTVEPTRVRFTIAVAFGVSARRVSLARHETPIALGRRLPIASALVTSPNRKTYGTMRWGAKESSSVATRSRERDAFLLVTRWPRRRLLR
jgi:hypothetical protein